ncbi:MAG: FMN-binding protein, partial [Halioglobus sp.]|nr:FMN-binding protein [Halioglobus sp.]
MLNAQQPLGFAFRTAELAPISAYSGKPIDTLVGLGMDGDIAGVQILQHEEPILVIGISDDDLQAFIDQFAGKPATANIRVGAHHREGFTGIDGITGATITTMVLASSVNKSIARFAAAYGLPRASTTAGDASPAQASTDTTPQWHLLWQARKLELVILALALGLLLTILFLQDVLVKRKRLFERLRTGYLLFTVFFIGFY